MNPLDTATHSTCGLTATCSLTHDHAESTELLFRGTSHLGLQTRSCSAMARPSGSSHLLIQRLERNDPQGHQLRSWRLGLVTLEEAKLLPFTEPGPSHKVPAKSRVLNCKSFPTWGLAGKHNTQDAKILENASFCPVCVGQQEEGHKASWLNRALQITMPIPAFETDLSQE